MYTIFDYINFYKDLSLTESKWNIMDNLLCAILVYLPVESFESSKTLNDFYTYVQKYKASNKTGIMQENAYQLLESIKDTSRYNNLKIYNFQNLKNDNTQFGAMTFRIFNNTIISYKGTDGSLIGWIENIRIAYEYPTYTQSLAIKYLNKNINFVSDKNVYVVGHSKGGNLAMVSAMECTNINFNKIKCVYNFDGPGFRSREFNSLKYKKVSKKIINVLPSSSMVGILLNNKDYKIVKSDAVSINQHYPTSWNIFGQCFVTGTISKLSMDIHESTTSGIEQLDNLKLKTYFETIFKNIQTNYSSDVSLKLEDMLEFYKSMKNIDPEISKYIDIIINSMINSVYEKKKFNKKNL